MMPAGAAVDVSVVVPLYDEEANVELLYGAIRTACEPLGGSFEIVFVDDGSTDGTFGVLERLHATDARVRVVSFRKNYGQTAAMAAGFRAARGHIIVSMDGDLQNDPADIPDLLAKMREGYDVVCGWRRGRKDKLMSRRVPSAIANRLIACLTGVRIHDNGCSLKAYDASIIKRVALYSEFHRFIPALSTLAGARVAEIVVRHHRRQFGRSKYGLSRAWRVLLDVFIVTMLSGYASRPMLWFGLGSLVAATASAACLVTLFATRIHGIVLPTVVLLGVALVGHMLAVGVLAQLLVHTGHERLGFAIPRVVAHER